MVCAYTCTCTLFHDESQKQSTIPAGTSPGSTRSPQKVRGVPTVVRASAYHEDDNEDIEDIVASDDACQLGTNSSVSRCGQKRCLTCPALDSNNLITCKRCGIQYVGETGQQLKRRMNNHRNRIKSLQPQPLY